MRTRLVLMAFAMAGGISAYAVTSAGTQQHAVLESSSSPAAQVAVTEPVVVTAAPTTAVTSAATADWTPRPQLHRTATTVTTAPARPHPVVDASHLDDGVVIEHSDNSGFFTFGDDRPTAGSATSREGDDSLEFFAYCGADEAGRPTCRATLENLSDAVIHFPGKLVVSFEMSRRGGETVTVSAHSEVEELAPGERVTVQVSDTRALEAGTYDYSATAAR